VTHGDEAATVTGANDFAMRTVHALFLGLLPLACGDAGPRLEVQPTRHDFGTVVAGSVAKKAYELKNTGGSDLVLRSVRGSCGCAILEVVATPERGLERRGDLSGHGDVLVLAPGERGEIRVTIDPQRAPPEVPEGLWSILLETNERDRPYLRLEYHAHFDVPFNVSPQTVSIESMGPLERVERVVTLTPTLGRTFEVYSPESVAEGIDVHLERDAAFPLPRYLLRIGIGPGLQPEQLFSAVVVLPTDYAPGHTLSIPIRARVTGILHFHPPAFEILLPQDPEGGASSVVVLRTTLPEGGLAVESVRVEGDASQLLHASASALEESRAFEIRLEADPALPRSPTRGEVVVVTGDPARPEVRIPYRVGIRP
jgi:hypothetical protein